MERKVIKQGTGGHTISLPITWVKENKIKPGDGIKLSFSGKNLVILANSLDEQSAEIKLLNEGNSTLRLLLYSIYRSGLRLMTVVYETPNQKELLLKVIEDFFVGINMVSDTKNKITFQIDSFEENMEALRAKLFSIVSCSFDELDKKLNNKPYDIVSLTKHFGKADNLFRRTLTLGNQYNSNIGAEWSTNLYLQLIQHSIDHFSTIDTDKVSNEIINLFKEPMAFWKKIVQNKKSIEKLQKIHFEINVNRSNILSSKMTIKKPSDMAAHYYAIELLRLQYLLLTPLMSSLM